MKAMKNHSSSLSGIMLLQTSWQLAEFHANMTLQIGLICVAVLYDSKISLLMIPSTKYHHFFFIFLLIASRPLLIFDFSNVWQFKE